MKLQYLGHSAFKLTLEKGLSILIDPYLDKNPLAPLKASDLKADYIVLTHAHGDHLGDSASLARQCNPLFICVSELARYLGMKGLRTHAMQIGGAFEFDFGRLKLTPALHGSATPEGSYAGLAAGVIIRSEGICLYHCGDTGIFLDMKLIGELDRVDYMLTPIGGNYTMDIHDALKAVDMVNASTAIPMHFNTFPLIEADPLLFQKGIESQGRKCIILKPGEEIGLSIAAPPDVH